MVDGILDLLLMLTLLGVCLVVGVTSIMGVLEENRLFYEEYLEDKATPRFVGVQPVVDTDITFSRQEIILMTQVQGSSLTFPAALTTACGMRIEIADTYDENKFNYGLTLFAALSSDPVGSRYVVEYHFGDVNTTADDSRRIRRIP